MTEIITAFRSCMSAATETLLVVKYCSSLEAATNSCGCYIGLLHFAEAWEDDPELVARNLEFSGG